MGGSHCAAILQFVNEFILPASEGATCFLPKMRLSLSVPLQSYPYDSGDLGSQSISHVDEENANHADT